MPTLKAIHIGKSHQPTLQPKIAKEYVFANALQNWKLVANLKDKWLKKRTPVANIVYSAFGG